jgi:hypothetical protein
VAAVVVGWRELRMVADSVVHRQGRAVHLRLRVAAGHAAAPALRPVHAVRLESVAADQPGLDPRRSTRSRWSCVRRSSRRTDAARRSRSRAGPTTETSSSTAPFTWSAGADLFCKGRAPRASSGSGRTASPSRVSTSTESGAETSAGTRPEFTSPRGTR